MNRIGMELNVDFLQEENTHFQMEVELLFLLEGEAELTVGEDVYPMKKDTVIVVNSEKKHSLHVKQKGLLCKFTIDYQTISDYLGSNLFLFWCNSATEETGDYDKLRGLMQQALAGHLSHHGKEDFGMYGIYYQIMDLLVKKFLIDNHDIRYQENRDEFSERIHQIMGYVLGNYSKELTLNELAEKLYLSNAYLSRFFKKNLGQNFRDYLNNIRLYHAVDDLLGTDKNMTRIAMDNGFSSVSRFNQVFREAYHISPLAYREKHLADKEEEQEGGDENAELMFDSLKSYMKKEQIAVWEGTGEQRYEILEVDHRRYAHKNWNRAINIGTSEDLQQAQVQRDIVKIHDELDFTYIRFWNIFEDCVCAEDAVYNFDRIDRNVEFLLEHHMKPFIVLGGKSRIIKREFKEDLYNQKANESEFLRKPKLWERLLKQFCMHLLECFGREEVSTWVFELWKPAEWDECYDEHIKDWYSVWFAATVKTLRRYYPQVMIGGCEFAATWDMGTKQEFQWIAEFWKKIDFKPDFLSIAVYPYERYQPSMNDEYLRDDLLEAKKIFAQYGYETVPIMATEWSNTLSNRNIYNDSCYKGAYIIQNLTMNMDLADKIIYWMGTDMFGEFADTADMLYGGVGLLNKNGIRKPAFYAFAFLKNLYKYQIACTRNYCLTTDGNQNYRLLCNNMKKLSCYYCMNPDRLSEIDIDNYENYFEDIKPLLLKLQLKGVLPGEYEIRIHSVSKVSGSILDEWINWNCPSAVKRSDIEYLKQICQPKITLRRQRCREDGLNLDIELPANAFELIEIHYRTEEENLEE